MYKFAILGLFVSSMFCGLASATTNCTGIQKQILCVSYSDCNWTNGRCVNISSEEQLDATYETDQNASSNIDESSRLAGTSGWEYLGCAVDDQQCGSRAQAYSYSQHRSETSIYCPNASKLGCYGK